MNKRSPNEASRAFSVSGWIPLPCIAAKTELHVLNGSPSN